MKIMMRSRTFPFTAWWQSIDDDRNRRLKVNKCVIVCVCVFFSLFCSIVKWHSWFHVCHTLLCRFFLSLFWLSNGYGKTREDRLWCVQVSLQWAKNVWNHFSFWLWKFFIWLFSVARESENDALNYSQKMYIFCWFAVSLSKKAFGECAWWFIWFLFENKP